MIDVPYTIELLKKRQEIDNELAGIFAHLAMKKPVKCGSCSGEGHTARNCPDKQA